MTKSVAYSIYSADLLEMAVDPEEKWRNEVRRGRGLIPQSPPAAGGALSWYPAGASRGNRRDREHPGKLSPPPLDRAETRRPRREPEGTQRRLHAGQTPGANHDGRRSRDYRGRLRTRGMYRGEFLVMPARASMPDARRIARRPPLGHLDPAQRNPPIPIRKAQARNQLQHLGSSVMHACVASGAGFLIAVLWFDLMFDVQTRKHAGDALPAEVLASISAYYRRVTIEAYPMNRLIAVVMILTLLAIVTELLRNVDHWWIGWGSLAAAASAIGLARVRSIPNAIRLGRAADSPEVQIGLARAIYRDHIYCLAAIAVVLGLQLSAAL